MKTYLVTFSLENKAFQTIETKIYENRKIGIFGKGLVNDFGQKVEVFSSVVFIKNRSRKSVC